MQNEAEQVAKLFEALAHPTRIKLFHYALQVQPDPVSPTVAAIELDYSVSRVGAQLKRMYEAGLLERQVTGRYTLYKISSKVKTMISFLEGTH